MTELLVASSRRRRVAPWIAGVIGVAVLVLVAVLATRPPRASVLADSPLLGKPAPEVVGEDLNGETVRLSQMRGRYVVLNFFASWCAPCRAEHDDLLRFSSRHAATGDARVVAVLWDDTPARARRFFEEHGGDWPVLVNASGKVSLDFGVRGPPESFVIDPDGFVIARYVGEVQLEALEALLAEAESQRGSEASS